MRIIDDAWNRETISESTVATVGNFDGIHRGQQRVLARVKERAEVLGVESAVVTFDPHPLEVLRPERPPQRITIAEQKESLITDLGLDLLINVRFTKEFSQTSARSFVEDLLFRKVGTREIHVGSDFGFGYRRQGNLDLLQALGEELGFVAEGLSEFEIDGDVVSSTRVRNAVREGRVEDAAVFLGRPFALVGEVVRGEGRGKEQGWPTINIEPEHLLLPANGVYASQVWLPARQRLVDAVTNVGLRPTFANGNTRVVEAHLFDFDEDIYQERVELSFAVRLREEKRFPSVDELIEQISMDAHRAREYLRREDCSVLLRTISR